MQRNRGRNQTLSPAARRRYRSPQRCPDLCAADGAGLLITIAARLDALPYPLPVAQPLRSSRRPPRPSSPWPTTPETFFMPRRIVRNDWLCLPKWPTLRARHKISYRRLQAGSSVATAPPVSPKQSADGANEAFREKRGGNVRHNERAVAHAKNPFRRTSSFGELPAPSFRFRAGQVIEQAAAIGAELLRACGLAGRAFDGARAISATSMPAWRLFVYQRHADGERPGGTPIRSPGGLFVSLIREIEHGHHDLARALATMRQRRRVERRH